MSKWNLIIDIASCINCNNCVVAVKDEFENNTFVGYSAPQPRHGHYWIDIARCIRGSGPMVDAAYMPKMCNHCDNAPCIEAAGDGAVYKREDGIVIMDPEKTRGRREIQEACPYGAVSWNEELDIPQTWFFDAHLLDQGWKEPRCVQACPTAAMTVRKVEDREMAGIAAEEGLAVRNPDLGTRPRVYYKNLYRFVSCFIGGNVAVNVDGEERNLGDVEVRLFKGDRLLAETTTDQFGDFKFDGRDGDSGEYSVHARHDVYGAAERQVTLGDSQYVELTVSS
jgi:Fe-S-cluster-containing dehydrogenase component